MPAITQFTVQMGEEDYRILGPEGEEGAMVPYGTLATLQVEDAVYYSLVEDADEEMPVVYRVDSVSPMPTKLEEVEFPERIVKAQRALDEAIEGSIGPQVVDVKAETE